MAAGMLLALVAPAPASAGTASNSGGVISIAAAPGETNLFEVFYRASEDGIYVLDEGGNPVQASTGFLPLIGTSAGAATSAAGVTALNIDLGDGDDDLAFQLSRPHDLQPDPIQNGAPLPATITVTIAGGAGDDFILGTDSADTIFGGPGNDLVEPQDGGDTVEGGPGNDLIFGLYSGAAPRSPDGGDTLRGGPARDTIIGDAGNDRIFGQGGKDNLLGRRGNDRIVGGKGPDTLLGGGGIDRLFAKDGTAERLISCGGGKDRRERAKTDRKDPKPRSC